MPRKHALMHTMAILLLLSGVVILLWPRLISMVRIWTGDGLYSFCFLIAPLSAFLAWKKRKRISAAQTNPSPLGLVMVAGTVGAILSLDRLGLSLISLTPLFLIGILGGTLWALYGFPLVRLLAFPLLLLLFLMPLPPVIPEAIDYPLQEFCARFTTQAAQSIGIQAQRYGASVELPNFTLGVAPACNGLRSSVSLLLLGVLFAYLCEGPIAGKVSLVAAAVPVAYLANFIRLFSDVVVVNALGSRFLPYEAIWDHVWGFLTFLVASLFLFEIARLFKCAKFRSIT